MKLTVLIADDEKMPRTVLKERLDWEALSVGEVFLASDGLEALELARTHRPDIIISDIKMPRMNGLELAAAVREFLPACRFIFLSGYSDKEYLKGAIRLKAASYVEKPIDLEEVTEAIREVVAELQKTAASDPAYRFYRGPDGEAAPLNSREYTLDKGLLRRLEGAVRQGRREEVMSMLEDMYAEISACEGTAPDYVSHLYRQIIFLLLGAAQSQNIPSLAGKADQLLYTDAKQATLRQLWGTLTATAEEYFSALRSPEPDLVSRVDRCLEKNYRDSALTVQTVADSLGFTYTYLCGAYKKSCGKTVNQRLTEIRLQKARELLTTTNRKLYEIANAVGYADGKYFVKVFSRETGLTPKQYRGRSADAE